MAQDLRSVDEESDAQRLVGLADQLADVSYVIGLEPDSGCDYVSESVAELLGYTAEELLDMPHPCGMLPDPRDRAAWERATSAPPGETTNVTVRWTTKDGQAVWMDHRCVKHLRGDGSVALYGVARDVTAEVETERVLREQQERMRLMLENATDVVLDINPDNTFRWVSPSMERLMGWRPADLIGQSSVKFIHPDDVPMTGSARDSPQEGVSRVPRFRVKTADGGYRWMSGIARQLRGPDGVLVGWVAGLHDVDATVRTELALAASEEHFRLLAENGSDLLFRARPDAVPEWVSPSVQEVLGWDPEDIVGHSPVEFIHPDDLATMVSVNDEINAGDRGEVEVRLRTAAGDYRWMALIARPIKDANGMIIGRIGSARDIQREVEARSALAHSEQQFRQAMESAPVGMAIVDLDRRFVVVNDALCRMLARDEEWLLSHRIPDVLREAFDRADLQMRARVLSGRSKTETREKCMIRGDGSLVWVEHSVGLLLDQDGTPQSYVSQFFDITAAKHGRDQLLYLADHDPLTRLLTRRALLDGIERIGSHPPRTGSRMGALFIDIDRFKTINDNYGHAIGDQLLVEVAERISASARSDDLVARLGGDEMVIALPTLRDAADATRVAEKIHSALDEPVVVEGMQIKTTVSIGIAVVDEGEEADLVLRHADKALYRAKRTGRHRTVTYDPVIDLP